MSAANVEAIADAILYEGYMLYPYRRSALKNRAGWTFGVIAPAGRGAEAGPSSLECRCLVVGRVNTEISAKLRFLLPLPEGPERMLASPCEVIAPPARLDGLEGRALVTPFTLAQGGSSVEGRLQLAATRIARDAYLVAVTVSNLSPERLGADRWESHAMVSTHVLLGLRDGEFVPPRDPPPDLAAASEASRGGGLWPILIGERGRRDLLLCSPIVLEDHPEVAPESPGSLFDGTEIDEILTLRILTLTHAERDEIARGDSRVRELIRRTEALTPAELGELHGAMRAGPAVSEPRRTLRAGDCDLTVGDRVRLRPARRADIMDMALAGRLATIVAVERDLDDRSYLAVTVDDDPGQDLGTLGKPGHRFFFGLDEVELVSS